MDNSQQNIAAKAARNQRKRKSPPLCNGKENKTKPDSKYESLKDMSTNSRFSFCNEEIMKDLGVGLLADIPSNHATTAKMEHSAIAHKKKKSHPRVLVSSSVSKSKVTNFDDCAQDVYNSNNDTVTERSSSDASYFLHCRKRAPYAEDHSSKMSDEVLLNLFKWLPKHSLVNCALTCKRWKTLSFDETLWKRVDASRRQLKAGIVGTIVNRGVQVLRMSLTEVSHPVFNREDEITTSKLKYLDLSMAAISTDGINELLSVCKDLRKISLEKCDLDDNTFLHLSKNTHLHTVNLALCHGLSCQAMNHFFTGCHRLIELNVGWSDLSQDKETLIEFMQNLPLSIRKLNISGMRKALTDEGIEDLTVNCPNLEELDISDCTELTALSIKHLVSKLMRLKFLSVNRCFSIPPNEYLMLKNMSSLEVMEIYGILNEESLNTLKRHLSKIGINKTLFSTIARPTVGTRRTSIWGIRVRD